jgi:long-chain fatty acid transport protein
VSANLAVQLTSWLFIGGGITFQSPSVLELNIRGDADALQPERRSHLEHEFRGDLTSIRYPDVGAQVRLTDSLSLGLTYRGAFELKNTIRATVDGDITGLGDPIPLGFTLESISVSTYVPQQLDMAIAWRPEAWPRLRIGFDLTWVDWSKHTSLIPTEDIVLTLESPPGLGIDVPSEIVGRRPIAMELKDRFVPRVGVEVRALDEERYALDLRAGYVYERTPFPPQRGVTNFIDGTRHQLALGAGFTLRGLEPVLRGGIRFDAHFLYARVMNRRHVKDSLVDPVGDYVAGGHQFGAGVAVEIAFE